MLMEPASKVSVPFTVVTRKRSRVAAIATEPEPKTDRPELTGSEYIPCITQVLPVRLAIVMTPVLLAEAEPAPSLKSQPPPANELLPAVPLTIADVQPTYPEVVSEPPPI